MSVLAMYANITADAAAIDDEWATRDQGVANHPTKPLQLHQVLAHRFDAPARLSSPWRVGPQKRNLKASDARLFFGRKTAHPSVLPNDEPDHGANLLRKVCRDPSDSLQGRRRYVVNTARTVENHRARQIAE